MANQFEPSWLVICTPSPTATACPVDGMALLPSPGAYTNLSLRILGGPFTQRWQVENLRASLIRNLNLPSHAMYVFVVDSGGRTLGGFWLGALKHCNRAVDRLLGRLLNSPPLRRLIISDRMALDLLRHCAEEMNHLAAFLPALYADARGLAG